MINNWLNVAQQWLYPATCIFCSQSSKTGYDCCHHCLQQLARNEPCCPQCGQRTPIGNDALCGRCQTSSPYFDHSYIPYRFEPPISGLIHQFKFAQSLVAGGVLSDLLSDFLVEKALKFDGIVPVPLHRQRIKQRGFNQSLELAKRISQMSGKPLYEQAIQRVQQTPAQSTLSLKERKHNVKGAFRLVKPINAQHLIVVDDVVTSGSTCDAVAKLLKEAGVAQVSLVAIARA